MSYIEPIDTQLQGGYMQPLEPVVPPLVGSYHDAVTRGADDDVTYTMAVQTADDDSPDEREVAEGLARLDDDPELQPLNEIYELERQDPKHRMGNFLYVLNEYYKALNPRPRMPFFSWVDGLTVMTFRAAVLPSFTMWEKHRTNIQFWIKRMEEFKLGVKYKGPGLIDKYRIAFEGGLVKRLGKIAEVPVGAEKKMKWVNTGKKEPYSTAAAKSHWSGDGWGIWVESKNREFYSNRMKVGRFQHSSFLAGDNVAAAGEWQVENGVIKKISGRSGHYRPGLGHLLQALRDLQRKGVTHFDQIEVVLFGKSFGAPPREIQAGDLLRMTNPGQQFKVDPNAI